MANTPIKVQANADEIITITADAFSSGAVYRLPDTPTVGEQGTGRIAISANSTLVIGGQAIPSRWLIETISGVLTYTNAPQTPVPSIGNGNSILRLFGSGAPGASTGLGIAGTASEYIDTTNAQMYLNAGTAATPSWKQITRAA
jgi:hypothetical protein